MIIVSNSTPLIALDAIVSLGLLKSLFVTVHIPEAVYDEIVIAGTGKAGASAVATAVWISRHNVANQTDVAALIANNSLDVGESEAIVLAQELKADFILLDDRTARREAQRLGLNVLGTVGVLLRAKDKSLIQEVKPLLDALLNVGIYLDNNLYQLTLKLAAE